MNQTSAKTFEEIEPLVVRVGSEMLRHVNGQFTLDDQRRKIYKEVFNAITTEKKGLFVVGGVGTGKTIMMKVFSKILRDDEGSPIIPDMIDSNTLIREFLDKDGAGFGVIDRYSRRHYFTKNNHKPRGLCIDDLGMEDQKVKSYGNEANVIADVLFARYNEMLNSGMRTFATSNIAPARLGDIYGTRIADRMIEMFKVIQLTGNSLRK